MREHPDRTASYLGWAALAMVLLFPALGIPYGWALGAAAALGAAFLKIVGRRHAGELALRDGALRVEGSSLVVAARDVVNGYAAPDRSGAEVVLELRDGRRVVTRVASEEEADALLAAAGVSPERRRTRVRLSTPERRLVFGLGVSVLTLALTLFAVIASLYTLPVWAFPPMILGGMFGLPLAILRATRPPEVVIGLDGVRVARGLRGPLWIPYAELASVELAAGGFRLVRKDGGVERVSRGLLGTNEVAAIRAIEAALAAYRARGVAPEARARLAREGRAVTAWRAGLRGAGHDDYRAAALSDDDLEAILSAPDASLEQRVGATLALAARDRPRADERVRVAVAATADVPARIALRAALEGDDEALAEALADAEAETARRARQPG